MIRIPEYLERHHPDALAELVVGGPVPVASTTAAAAGVPRRRRVTS
jgi:hypothetical protein